MVRLIEGLQNGSHVNGQCGKESLEVGGEECGGGNVADHFRIWEMPKAHALSLYIQDESLTVGWRWLVKSEVMLLDVVSTSNYHI